MKAIGCLFYCKTTPIPVLDALVSISMGRLKFRRARIGAEAIAFLRVSKESLASPFQLKPSLFSKSVRVLQIGTFYNSLSI